MTDPRCERGAACEQLATRHLESLGLTILARNLRCRAGELDLVVLDAGVLVIVEVRQRGSADFGGALASVGWRKQRKLVRAAQYLLAIRRDWRAYPMRFDVVAVQGAPDGAHELVWVKNAFTVT